MISEILLDPVVADAAEIKSCPPDRRPDDLVAVKAIRETRVAPSRTGITGKPVYPPIGYGVPQGRETAYLLMLRRQAEMLDGMQTVSYKDDKRTVITIDVFVYEEFFKGFADAPK